MVAAGLLALLTFFALTLGAPTYDALHVHDTRATAPAGYKASAAADPNEVLSLRIALKTDTSALVQKLLDVSTPGSKDYRKFLSKAQVEKLTAPSADGVAAVNAWLKKNGLTATPGATNQWLNIEVPVAKANAMLDTDFTVYENKDTGISAVRTLAYSLPKSVKPFVDFIYPVTAFPVQSSRGIAAKHTTGVFRNSTMGRRAGTADPSCAETMTPQCLQALYNIPTDPATQSSNTMVVSSFVNSFASTADLSSFLSDFRPDMSSDTTFAVTTLDGGQNDESQPSTEGSLDIQYTVGIATEVPTTFFTVGSNNGGDLTGFLDLVNELISQDNPPTVFTTSFGFPEELVPEDLANNICNAYAQLGARGTSILFSSGDSGVDDGQGGTCTTFRPTFPSGCPFVTVVGATQGVSPEVAADFSSGGFSNVFTQPDYQQDAVGSYLSKLGDVNAGLFNTGGRGFPDVSAAGVAYQVNIGGEVQPVSGTSASTPLFASMVALLNDRLIAGGQAPIGFLNPMLYSSGLTALDDVVQGSNPGCGTDGFPADQGWDPVTGLGTPDFAKFLTVLGL
ncbi:family S53 protease-like protein [Lentinus tigrinus ALCF2SS1-7]|uniref:family S53 protease-like protein n=1 Tax=Lentinus tigrinus ALCF2SS1-7 TaxID=1328758 RepID=UPI00116629C7|nr:family S53 protease-like protein [Lentinus tigrinus ALCF2SS1-7]